MKDGNSEVFFYSSCENRISAKGQVAIPKRFRATVESVEGDTAFVLVPGSDACLYLYTHSQFGAIRAKVREVALEKNDPEFFRSFMEEVRAIDLDPQGRFVIPAVMREYADLNETEVLFIGMDDRIELWSPAKRDLVREQRKDYQEERTANSRRIFGL